MFFTFLCDQPLIHNLHYLTRIKFVQASTSPHPRGASCCRGSGYQAVRKKKGARAFIVRSKMAPSITERTISACNGLQISSIPKEWADHAWNSDFLEWQGFPEVLENNIFDCGCFVRELQELLVISRLWSTSEGQGSLSEGNITFLVIWFTELRAFYLRLVIFCIVWKK